MPKPVTFPDVLWTEELDGMLIRLVGHDYSLSGIADALSRAGHPMSRNAVAGRIYRLRLNGRLPLLEAKERPKASAEPAPRGAQARKAVLPRARPAAGDEPVERREAPHGVEPIVREEPPADRVSPVTGAMLRLDDPWPAQACRYPTFDQTIDRSEPIFCGARVTRGPYCEAHRRLVYLPPENARDRADRNDRGGKSPSRGPSPDVDDPTPIRAASR